MITMIKDWEGSVEVNGKQYDSMTQFISGNTVLSGEICIKLHSSANKGVNGADNKATGKVETQVKEDKYYKITVKQYMTKPASPEFDFMAKWNNDNPMPLRTMTGVIEKETRGMVYMKLRGEAEETCTCLRCGRKLTNPVSRYYGIGPECMEKLGMIRMDINDVEGISKKLTEVHWEGWIIKSAITSQEEV